MSKKICVINTKTKDVLRVEKQVAEHLFEAGGFKRTTKAKLRSYLNQQAKLHRNKRTIDAMAKLDIDTKLIQYNVGPKRKQDKRYTRIAVLSDIKKGYKTVPFDAPMIIVLYKES